MGKEKSKDWDRHLENLINAVVNERVEQKVNGTKAKTDSTGVTRNEFELSMYLDVVYGCMVFEPKENTYAGYHWVVGDPGI